MADEDKVVDKEEIDTPVVADDVPAVVDGETDVPAEDDATPEVTPPSEVDLFGDMVDAHVADDIEASDAAFHAALQIKMQQRMNPEPETPAEPDADAVPAEGDDTGTDDVPAEGDAPAEEPEVAVEA